MYYGSFECCMCHTMVSLDGINRSPCIHTHRGPACEACAKVYGLTEEDRMINAEAADEIKQLFDNEYE